MPLDHAISEKFAARVTTPDGNGCLLWQGHITRKGYGIVSHRGLSIFAHRAAWMLANGDIPDGFQINHRCDVRACVSVEHLYLGTQAENVADMWARGRVDRRIK